MQESTPMNSPPRNPPSAAEPAFDQMRELLESVLRKNSTSPVALKIVEDIAAWAAESHVKVNGNPIATAVPARLGHPWTVALRCAIDEGEISSVLSRFDFCGLSD